MEYGTGARVAPRRRETETKQAFKTTEFWAYLLAVLAVLIAGTVDDAEGTEFGADDVWLFVTLLTIGYLISRGLAKSGSRDPYTERPTQDTGEGIGDRVKAAAHVLKEGEQPSQAPTQTHEGGTRL